VLNMPKPVVWITAFGDSSIEHEIRIWISDPEAGIGSVRSEILGRLWQLFRDQGIDIPFPQRDVRVKQWPAQQGHPPGTGDAGGPIGGSGPPDR